MEYGLVDGPIHWRQSLLADLEKLGYKMSALDPCVMRLFDASGRKLFGAIAIEVDDLFMVGHEEHHLKMAELQKKYTFGKYVELQKEPMGCAFNGRRVRQLADGEFQIDMEKFILERLQPVTLERGRASQKKEPATEEEKSQSRAACGALNWLSKEGRPDAAGPSSLMASKLSKLTIEDITSLNAVIKGLKENASLTIRIQPLLNMRLSIVTDASCANNGFHSQGGQILLAHERHLRDGLPSKTNVLAWRSGKLQRVVNSTLAAETQSLSKGLADLSWAIVLTEELQNGKFNVKEWRAKVDSQEMLVLSSASSDLQLKEALAVVDAKSLFDHLSKETVGGSDRRNAIEIQIIRQDLRQLKGEVKWVEHLATLADSLTKVQGSNEALYRVLTSGRYSIRPEVEAMSLRDPQGRQGSPTPISGGLGSKRKVGAVKRSIFLRPQLIPDHRLLGPKPLRGQFHRPRI